MNKHLSRKQCNELVIRLNLIGAVFLCLALITIKLGYLTAAIAFAVSDGAVMVVALVFMVLATNAKE